jgi:hypothetical protein
MADRDDSPTWKKSRRSATGACVEILIGPRVLVRDSRRPDGPTLSFSRTTFGHFLDAVKRGEFDCIDRQLEDS